MISNNKLQQFLILGQCDLIVSYLQVEFERINGKVAVATKKLDTFDKVSIQATSARAGLKSVLIL